MLFRSGNNNNNNHHKNHGTPDNNQGGGGGNANNTNFHHGNGIYNGSPQIIVSSAPAGFPTHLSSLASYYSQLNQVQGMHAPGATLTPSLAHMAQYGQLPGGQNPYTSIGHHQPNGTPTTANGTASANDFRRALPVIF